MSGLRVPPECCSYCGVEVQVYDTGDPNGEWRGRPVPKDQRTLDHVLPLSEGGRRSATIVSCAGCNGAKANRTPREWLLAGGVTAEMLANGDYWQWTGVSHAAAQHAG